MKLTLKELKRLIRENVQEEMRQEGIDEIFGVFGGKPKGLFASDKNFGKDFSDAIRNAAEKALQAAIENRNVDRNNQYDKDKSITRTLEILKNDLPQKPEGLESYIMRHFHSTEKIRDKLRDLTHKTKPPAIATDEDLNSIRGIFDTFLHPSTVRQLTHMETVNTVKESIRAIVREEVKRQLRLKS